MSKVQSPKSQTDQTSEQRRRLVDGGVWTLDFGLKAIDLRKSFLSPGGEKIDVLRGIFFSASAGEIVAISGASGAGKSTLLHLLGGLEAADHGTVLLGQFDITQVSASTLARFRNNRVGFVFQFHHLLADLTALENVALPLMIARRSRDESMARATGALERLGLGERLNHPIGHLSGGEQQQVAVARALVTIPEVVLADEPTGNLDRSISDEIGAVLVAYCRERRAVVVVATHNERLAKLCDRILLLEAGLIREASKRV